MTKSTKSRTRAKRARAAQKRGTGIDTLVEVQKRALGRYVVFASGVAQQLSDGDLSFSRWLGACATVWKGLADDMQDMANVMLKNAAK